MGLFGQKKNDPDAAQIILQRKAQKRQEHGEPGGITSSFTFTFLIAPA